MVWGFLKNFFISIVLWEVLNDYYSIFSASRRWSACWEGGCMLFSCCCFHTHLWYVRTLLRLWGLIGTQKVLMERERGRDTVIKKKNEHQKHRPAGQPTTPKAPRERIHRYSLVLMNEKWPHKIKCFVDGITLKITPTLFVRVTFWSSICGTIKAFWFEPF